MIFFMLSVLYLNLLSGDIDAISCISGKSQDVLPQVCHERTKGFYTPKCGAAQELRVGPSKPPFRWRLQTTLSFAGKEPGW